MIEKARSVCMAHRYPFLHGRRQLGIPARAQQQSFKRERERERERERDTETERQRERFRAHAAAVSAKMVVEPVRPFGSLRA